jgi:peptide/nickel transport system substrate-binding protein
LQRPRRRSPARRTRRPRGPSPARFLRSRLSLAILGVAILAACAVVGTEERPAPGGVYREAVVGQPLSLNSLVHPNDPIARDVGRLVYSGLVRIVDGTSIIGDLAREWATTPDGLTYTFRLRPEARWHDGQSVTSADVLATVALLQSPAYPGPREVADIWRGVRVEAPDPTTVVFRLAQPFAPFIEACSFSILPRHLFGADGAANLLDHPNSYSPVGSGPYRVRSVDVNGISLVRNEANTWERPLLDGIDLRYFPDPSAAAKALADGMVEGFAGTSRLELTSRNGGSAALTSHEAPLSGHQFMLFISEDNALLNEPAVRRAVARAIDRKAIVENALTGQGVAAYGPISVFSWAYSSVVEQLPDPIQAGRYLDEAGWVGMPRSRNGRELRVELATTTDAREMAMGEMVAGQLGALGLRVTFQPFDPLDFYRERLGARRFDLAIASVSLGTNDPDPSWLWHSSQRVEGLNFAAYSNPVADDLLARARADADPTRRLQDLVSFQQLWADDVPSVVLASPLLVYTMSSQVRGVRLGVVPEPSARFQHIEEWYLRTQRLPLIGR